jgi:hypothetical protein
MHAGGERREHERGEGEAVKPEKRGHCGHLQGIYLKRKGGEERRGAR